MKTFKEFIFEENANKIVQFKRKLAGATDPAEIERLRKAIADAQKGSSTNTNPLSSQQYKAPEVPKKAEPGTRAGGSNQPIPGQPKAPSTTGAVSKLQKGLSGIPKPTAGQAAVGALNVGLGALEYKGRRDAGQTRTQAGSGAVASAAGGQAGWMTGAKLGAALPIPNPLAKGAVTLGLGVAGGMLGSSGASALSDKLSGVTKPSERETLQRQAINQGKGLKGLENARQTSNIRDVRKVSTAYGTKQGSALTGLGGPAKVDTKAGTLTTKGKTVKLASTQLVRDPKTGQQRVGDLAYKGGKAVYLARPSVASRDTSLSAKVGRALNLGRFSKEAEQQAAKKEYRTALKNTQSYTKGLGISTKSATAQKLPGYSAAKPKPAVKPSPIFDIKNFNK